MAAAPDGTVTLLFTDIEGSTRLLREAGEAYGELLLVHRRLLREAFEAHGGYEVDSDGDAFAHGRAAFAGRQIHRSRCAQGGAGYGCRSRRAGADLADHS